MPKTLDKSPETLKADSTEDLRSMVQEKAYELYAKRGKRAGHALDDWLEAERLFRAGLAFKGRAEKNSRGSSGDT